MKIDWLLTVYLKNIFLINVCCKVVYVSYFLGQQVFRIEIADKNDHPPRFTQQVYVAEAIPEDANINALVTEVKALDNDTGEMITIFECNKFSDVENNNI